MKKFCWGLFLFLVMPFWVEAADYKITNQYIKADVEENGNLLVSELIVMEGTFNGYEKSLSYRNGVLSDEAGYENDAIYNAKDLELISIKAKKVKNVSFDTFLDTDFEDFEETSYAGNGSRNVYTAKRDINGYTYRIYQRTNREKVAFLVTYRLDRVVVLHQDVAELYWNFIMPNDYDDIKDVKVQINLPKSQDSDNFRFWAHGPLSGDIKALDSKDGVIAEIGYLENTELLDIRMTFDKDVIKDTSKVKMSNSLALKGILEVEERRADIANQLRESLLKKYNLVKYGTLIIYGLLVITGIYVYFKYAKSPKSGYYSKYNREFIDEYNVEVIDYLMNHKITSNAMSASIMNLIYKKNISVKEMENKKKSVKKDYIFILENEDNLVGSEDILVKFLFDKVGKVDEEGRKIFSTKDLKSYASGTKTCSVFIRNYTDWKTDVLARGRKEKFFETSSMPKVFGLIMLVLGLVWFSMGVSYGVDYVPTYILLIVVILFFLWTICLYKKSVRGSEHYDKWRAFKNFLQDFGAFDLKELPEIVLWERYLVYATIFGLADKVQRDMNVRIKELGLQDFDTGYYPSFVYINLGNTINNSINNAISSAYSRQSANYANSHSSSSSGGGFGGGFSSGGGFGGGGSSGHGF